MQTFTNTHTLPTTNTHAYIVTGVGMVQAEIYKALLNNETLVLTLRIRLKQKL